MLVMETDTFLAQPVTWFSDHDDNHHPTSCKYWVESSASMCDPWAYDDIATRVDYHLKGNAIYAIGCKALQDYFRKVQK